MLHLFLTPSPLLAAGVLVGISLPMFVAALIATYGDRIRLAAGDGRGLIFKRAAEATRPTSAATTFASHTERASRKSGNGTSPAPLRFSRRRSAATVGGSGRV